ncbi:MAG: hypothetical protein ABI142_00530 [Bryocella sp.]
MSPGLQEPGTVSALGGEPIPTREGDYFEEADDLAYGDTYEQ